MKRILLFAVTNIAVLVVLSVVFRLFGLDVYLYDRSGINMTGLLVFSAVFGMGGAFISLALSRRMAQLQTGARIIDQPAGEREAWLKRTVEKLAGEAGIGTPDVAIYPGSEVNAFATGMSRNKALVAVSEGLLRQMDADEVEGVLAHEIAHVANGDMVTMALLQGVLNTFVIFLARIIGFVVDRALSRDDRGGGIGFFLTYMAAQIVLGFLAQMIVAAFSRYREFRADAGGARFAGRTRMISALQRLQQTYEPSSLPQPIKAFGISGGFGAGLARLFATHPPLDERIHALQES